MAGICRNRTYKRISDSHNGFEDHEMHQHFNIPMSYYTLLQFITSRAFFAKNSLHFEKCLQPKNPP